MFLGAFAVTYVIIPFVACRPFHALWRQTDPAYNEPFQCINFMVAGTMGGVIGGFTDISACVVPLFIIRGQQEKFMHWAGLSFLLVIGFLYVLLSEPLVQLC